MTDVSFDVPILILAFNRPERFRGLITRLREIRPTSLFVSVDGPRQGNETDQQLVGEVHGLVLEIDWPCQVQTNFRAQNLGCGKAVSTGIDWFFTHVDSGIILEDDVLPNVDFFTFCEDLLTRYADDERVFAISGCNFAPRDHIEEPTSYRFSAITHIWGWATWRRAWGTYRYDMRDWRKRLPLRQRWRAMGANTGGFIYWTAVFDWMRFGKIDTWDYQWSLAQMAHGGLTATSNVNLTDNVGFAEDATHTSHKPAFVQPSEHMDLPLTHPEIRQDLIADRWVRSQILQATTQSAWRMVRDNVLQRAAAVRESLDGGGA